jgi:hypothetical protein
MRRARLSLYRFRVAAVAKIAADPLGLIVPNPDKDLFKQRQSGYAAEVR